MKQIKYEPIGIVHSPFKKVQGTPIQSLGAKNTKGIVEVFSKYSRGLKDIEGFSYLILIYHFHLIKKQRLVVKPYMDKKSHGIFATRAPSRPNPIGISIVKLEKRKKNFLYVSGIDIVDKTPLLDIKPYVPEFDVRKTNKIGWLKRKISKLAKTRDNGRFIDKN